MLVIERGRREPRRASLVPTGRPRGSLPAPLPANDVSEAVLDLPHEPGTDLIVPLANGEPIGVMGLVEAAADRLGEASGSTRCTCCMTGPTSTVATATGCGT